MRINSKWSYVMTGVNSMMAVIGAMFHNSFLLILGIIFTVWNWYVAEFNRRIEDEQIRNQNTKTEE